jgi:predicted acyltransferase
MPTQTAFYQPFGYQSSGRLLSLDAFRGFTIAGMILVNNPGDWNHAHAQLLHAHWNGWTFTDFIFPFFLFIGGVSMTLSLGKRAESGANKEQLFLQLAKRAGIIFLIGLFLNLFPYFKWDTFRIPGVLQRIAICTLCAAPVVIYGGLRSQIATILALFAVYTTLMLFVPVPDAAGIVSAGVLEPGRDFGAFIDRAVFGKHVWVNAQTWDPEGLVSTLPAVGSQLFGVLAGRWLATERTHTHKAVGMLLAGVAFIAGGLILDVIFMPINKSLWTPSYAVLMTGWALVIFAGFFYVLDAKPSRAAEVVFKPFVIYGMNALFIFAMSAFIVKVMMFVKFMQPNATQITLRAVLYQPFQALPMSPVNISLAYALCFNLVMFGLAWFLWWKKWFIKV